SAQRWRQAAQLPPQPPCQPPLLQMNTMAMASATKTASRTRKLPRVMGGALLSGVRVRVDGSGKRGRPALRAGPHSFAPQYTTLRAKRKAQPATGGKTAQKTYAP